MQSIKQQPKKLVEFIFENANASKEDLETIYIQKFQELILLYYKKQLKLHILSQETNYEFKQNTCFLIQNQIGILHYSIPIVLKGKKKYKNQYSLEKTKNLYYIDGIYKNLTFRVLKLRKKIDSQDLKIIKNFIFVHTYKTAEQINYIYNISHQEEQQSELEDSFDQINQYSFRDNDSNNQLESRFSQTIGRANNQRQNNMSNLNQDDSKQIQQEELKIQEQEKQGIQQDVHYTIEEEDEDEDIQVEEIYSFCKNQCCLDKIKKLVDENKQLQKQLLNYQIKEAQNEINNLKMKYEQY
ncbi:hypothetical protein ABPG72_016231 [Tetrahymena utriculariae]